MNKWMWKSTLLEIRNSMGRWLAILAIVALGVGLFCGLKVMREAMLVTEQEYLEETGFYDLQVYSPLGWTQEDADALLEGYGVLAVEPAYSRDFISQGRADNEIVITAISLAEEVNIPTVTAGRLPQAADECLGDRRWFTEDDIGTKVRVLSVNDEDTLEAFAYREYTLVGIGDSPLYMNFERGSTSIGTGTVSAFVCIPQEGFALDRYSDIYVRLDTGGAAPYSDEYKNAVKSLKQGVELLAADRIELYRTDILERYEEELEEARQELDDGWEEYNAGKKEAEDSLAAAKKELDNAAVQISENKRQLEDAEAQLNTGEVQVQEGLAQLDAAQAELDPQKEELAAQRQAFEEQKADALGQLDAAEAQYQAQLDAAQAILDTSWNPVELAQAWYDKLVATAALNEIASQRAEAMAQLNEAEATLVGYEAQVAAGQAEIDSNRQMLEEKQKEIETGRAEIAAGKKQLQAAQQQLNEGRKTYEEEKTKAEQELAEALEKLESGEKDYAKALDDYETLKDELTANDLCYLLDRDTNVAYVCYESDSSILNGIANVFPVFFFLVAILVCMTTMTRMVDEQRTQIGVLKAMGYSRGAILSKYLLYAGSSATLGSLVGFFGGSVLFPEVIWNAYGILYGFSGLHIVFNPVLGCLSLAAALLCSVGATWFSGRSEFSNVPAQLMRPKAPAIGKRIFFERLPWLWNRLNFLQKVAVRNLFRYKKRFVMMILGISGCTALVLTGFGIKDSIQNIVQYQFDEITTYDYNVTFSEDMDDGDIAAFEDAVDGLAGSVFVHTGTYELTAGDRTKDIYLVAARENLDGFVTLNTTGGDPLAYPGVGEAVISNKYAQNQGIRVGDTVTLTDDDQNTITVTVSGICKNFVYNYAFVNLGTFEDQWGTCPLVKNSYSNAAAGEDIDALGARIASYEKTINVQSSRQMELRFDSMMSSLDVVVLVVIACAGALAFIVLYNLTNINITERTREIATIKVLGFYPNESASYIFRENIILTVLGALVGLVLGRAFHAFVMSQINIDMVAFDVRVAPLSHLWAVLLTLLFSVLISRLMRVKIGKINMAESLKSVE